MQRALFPLNALLCPGGRLPLRVFESRYLDMVRDCLRNDIGFVVVLLKEGEETSWGDQAFYKTGTLAKVVDFDQGEDGFLHVVAEGQQQVAIADTAQKENGLWEASVIVIEDAGEEENFVAVPHQYEDLASVLKALVQHPMVVDLNLTIDFDDCRQVGWRLAELLPLDNSEKQYLFELNDPVFRLEKISDQLNRLAM